LPAASTIDADAALVRGHQRVEHAHGGGLAGTIGAEQAGDLPIAGAEADVGDRLDAAVRVSKALCRLSATIMVPIR
jgi:hypothetical protein